MTILNKLNTIGIRLVLTLALGVMGIGMPLQAASPSSLEEAFSFLEFEGSDENDTSLLESQYTELSRRLGIDTSYLKQCYDYLKIHFYKNPPTSSDSSSSSGDGSSSSTDDEAKRLAEEAAKKEAEAQRLAEEAKATADAEAKAKEAKDKDAATQAEKDRLAEEQRKLEAAAKKAADDAAAVKAKVAEEQRDREAAQAEAAKRRAQEEQLAREAAAEAARRKAQQLADDAGQTTTSKLKQALQVGDEAIARADRTKLGEPPSGQSVLKGILGLSDVSSLTREVIDQRFIQAINEALAADPEWRDLQIGYLKLAYDKIQPDPVITEDQVVAELGTYRKFLALAQKTALTEDEAKELLALSGRTLKNIADNEKGSQLLTTATETATSVFSGWHPTGFIVPEGIKVNIATIIAAMQRAKALLVNACQKLEAEAEAKHLAEEAAAQEALAKARAAEQAAAAEALRLAQAKEAEAKRLADLETAEALAAKKAADEAEAKRLADLESGGPAGAGGGGAGAGGAGAGAVELGGMTGPIDVPFVGLTNACRTDCYNNACLQGILSSPAWTTFLHRLFADPAFDEKIAAAQERLMRKVDTDYAENRRIAENLVRDAKPGTRYGSAAQGYITPEEEQARRLGKIALNIARGKEKVAASHACLQALKVIFSTYLRSKTGDIIPIETMKHFTENIRALSDDPENRAYRMGDAGESFILLSEVLGNFVGIPDELLTQKAELITYPCHPDAAPQIIIASSLPLPAPTEALDIQTMLQDAQKPTPSDEEAVCPDCRRSIKTMNTTSIRPPTNTLVITINRQQEGSGVKNKVPIAPNEFIIISDEEGNAIRYQLTGICSHRGAHWTAYKRGLTYDATTASFKSTREWRHISDRDVSTTNTPPNFGAGDEGVTVCFYSRVTE